MYEYAYLRLCPCIFHSKNLYTFFFPIIASISRLGDEIYKLVFKIVCHAAIARGADSSRTRDTERSGGREVRAHRKTLRNTDSATRAPRSWQLGVAAASYHVAASRREDTCVVVAQGPRRSGYLRGGDDPWVMIRRDIGKWKIDEQRNREGRTRANEARAR